MTIDTELKAKIEKTKSKKFQFPQFSQQTVNQPDPLGRKSRPTMLSNTEDFPELCMSWKTQLELTKSENYLECERERRTWPPTTAMEGSDSQRVGREESSPPWSPRAVQTRWIRLTRAMRDSMVAIGEEAVTENGRRRSKRRRRRRRIMREAILVCYVITLLFPFLRLILWGVLSEWVYSFRMSQFIFYFYFYYFDLSFSHFETFWTSFWRDIFFYSFLAFYTFFHSHQIGSFCLKKIVERRKNAQTWLRSAKYEWK